MTYFKPPTLTATMPDPHISIEARVFAWRSIRNLVARTDCTLDVCLVGWFTKKFTIRGDEVALSNFVALAWNDDLLGPEVRRLFNERNDP